MPQEPTSDQNPGDSEVQFAELDPSGRYGRYKEVLGKGAFKKVYRAFDEWEGIEVAWNQVKVTELLRNSEDLDRLYSEVHLLKTLKHKNIIKFYVSWVDPKNENINFITEIFTSGTLRQYRNKHKHVDLRALKKWARQILEGLSYLHSHDPPIIHRDLKCDNIFVNGNQGEVKIGDLGLAAILRHCRSAHSVIGTPEFMAPEFYEEDYNELVDIYAFGMCLLELVTFEYPYLECSNAAQIYKRVTSGIKPASLSKVNDLCVREFIEKCITKVPDRLPAIDLLKDSFLQADEDHDSIGHVSQPGIYNSVPQGEHFHNDIDGEELVPYQSRDFMIEGHRKDLNTIFLKLRIADATGLFRNIHFPFHVEIDTPFGVASEMVEELNLTHQDVSNIAETIDAEIRFYIPEFSNREASSDQFADEAATDDNFNSNAPCSVSPVHELSPSKYVLEKLPSGRKFWTESPRRTGDSGTPLRPGSSNLSQMESMSSADGWFIGNEQSLDGRIENKKSCKLTDDEHLLDDSDTVKNNTSVDPHFGSIRHPLENHTTSSDIISDDLKIIIEKIENLLVDQKRELDELHRKHELTLADLLKEVPPNMYGTVLNICHLET